MKDQPIDSVEFERLWEEIGKLWGDLNYGIETDDDYLINQSARKLKEIKYRFFNQLVY